MMNFLRYYRLVFVFFCFALFSCTKDEAPKDYVPEESKKAEITSWQFLGKQAAISGTNISITLPIGTDLKSLTATVEMSAGASISPDPTKARDYTKPLSFVVTAKDGTTKKTYTVTVSIEKSNKAEITSWQFLSYAAAINGTNISIVLFHGTDITNLKAIVKKSAGASISPDPSTPQDYTNPVKFTVTAEDGKTTKTYTVTVKMEHPIISWTGGWRDDKAYTANIDHKTNKITIDLNSADFETKVTLLSGTDINPDPNKVNDWEKEVSFKVSKGSMEKTYKVKVTVNGKDIIKVTNSNIRNIVTAQITKLGNTGNLNHIDVSSVTDMSNMFGATPNFNGDIGKWDVSKVSDMSSMFSGLTEFNQDIGNWDVSNVTNMANMFFGAEKFNQDIGKWVVSKVTDMSGMFSNAKAFDKNIGNWTVSEVINMRNMFFGAAAFNQDIGKWKDKVSNVTNMSGMFTKAKLFNQNIGNWKVSKVNNMSSMFFDAAAFNQDISKWTVSNVTNMSYMFFGATKFNQNISGWTVKQVKKCSSFSLGATAFIKSNKPKFTCSQ